MLCFVASDDVSGKVHVRVIGIKAGLRKPYHRVYCRRRVLLDSTFKSHLLSQVFQIHSLGPSPTYF